LVKVSETLVMTKLIIILALVYLIVSRLSTFSRKGLETSPKEEKQGIKNKTVGEYVDYEEIDESTH